MDVSIVIVNWNTCDCLKNCLNSIYENTTIQNFEIIVIDNNSIDGSANMVREEFPSVIIIANNENRGFAAANNQGIAIATGRYILLLNSDTLVCEKTIDKTLMYADSKLGVSVVGCQVWINSKEVQMTCFRFPGLLNLFFSSFALNRLLKYNSFFGREWMLWWKRDSEIQVDVVSGMFMFIKREALDDVGLLDEDYFIYTEEADLCYRFHKNGWDNIFWPGAKIIHVHGGGASSKQVNVKMAVQSYKSILIFIKKHANYFNYLLGHIILFISYSLRLCIWILLLFIKKIIGNDGDKEIAEIKKNWAILIFSIIRVEP